MKTILWDFDGVILDSMKVRNWGFREIFKDFDNKFVQKLIEYHIENGGLSRYVKIRYFYEKILKTKISEDKIFKYAEQFSILMKKKLINKDNLIDDSLVFIKNNFKKYNFHIVSGSDDKELNYLCKKLDISKYFISIHGSPTCKNDLVKNLLTKHKYSQVYLIGDSINDFEAAKINNIKFYGYNNPKLISLNPNYINSFHSGFNLYL